MWHFCNMQFLFQGLKNKNQVHRPLPKTPHKASPQADTTPLLNPVSQTHWFCLLEVNGSAGLFHAKSPNVAKAARAALTERPCLHMKGWIQPQLPLSLWAGIFLLIAILIASSLYNFSTYSIAHRSNVCYVLNNVSAALGCLHSFPWKACLTFGAFFRHFWLNHMHTHFWYTLNVHAASCSPLCQLIL
jgi:hypothetical protein